MLSRRCRWPRTGGSPYETTATTGPPSKTSPCMKRSHRADRGQRERRVLDLYRARPCEMAAGRSGSKRSLHTRADTRKRETGEGPAVPMLSSSACDHAHFVEAKKKKRKKKWGPLRNSWNRATAKLASELGDVALSLANRGAGARLLCAMPAGKHDDSPPGERAVTTARLRPVSAATLTPAAG
nr:uncharacterized protein LOC129382497 [Dermacentor andersoni]